MVTIPHDEPARVLVVEDSATWQAVIQAAIGRDPLRSITMVRTAAEARDQLNRGPLDAVLLDLGLPDGDGVELCAEIRARSDAHIIILSGRSSEIDRVVGLSVGADDYVTKPFSAGELDARLRSAIRRRKAAAPTTNDPHHSIAGLTHFVRSGAHGPATTPHGPTTTPPSDERDRPDQVGDVHHVAAGPPAYRPARPVDQHRSERPGIVWVDRASRTVTVAGDRVILTRTEFELLDALLTNQGTVLTRAQLELHIWGPNHYGASNLVDTHIGNLRRKLRSAGSADSIVTVRGVGFKLVHREAPDAHLLES